LPVLEKLLADNRYPQAWQLARQLAPAHEGEPLFDYLYGLSALETGHYDYAVFALERVVIQQTTAARPRLALARAYMNMKNTSAALREFRTVLLLNPPVEVRKNVQRLISRLEQLAERQKKRSQSGFNARATFTVGYDANANFGADTATVTMPLLGNVVLDDSSVRQASPFNLLQGQFDYHYEVSKNLSWFVNTGLGSKHYNKAQDFNTKQIKLKGGLSFETETKQYQLAVNKHSLWLDSEKYQSVEAVEISVAHNFANASVLSGVLSFDRQRFQQQRDKNVRNVAAAAGYLFRHKAMQHQLQGTLSWGKATEAAFEHNAKDTAGLRYTITHSWDENQSSSAALHYQHLRHLANHPVYAEKRRDRRFSLGLKHAIRVSKKASWFVEAGWTNNQSNLSLYDTDKSYIQTGLSYSF